MNKLEREMQSLKSAYADRVVMKFSKKPFKSTFQKNTVKDVVLNENSGKPAFTFHEDDSCVDWSQCYVVNN